MRAHVQSGLVVAMNRTSQSRPSQVMRPRQCRRATREPKSLIVELNETLAWAEGLHASSAECGGPWPATWETAAVISHRMPSPAARRGAPLRRVQPGRGRRAHLHLASRPNATPSPVATNSSASCLHATLLPRAHIELVARWLPIGTRLKLLVTCADDGVMCCLNPNGLDVRSWAYPTSIRIGSPSAGGGRGSRSSRSEIRPVGVARWAMFAFPL